MLSWCTFGDNIIGEKQTTANKRVLPIGTAVGAIGSSSLFWLWFWQEVSNLAFCFYVSSLNQDQAAVVPAEGNSISPPLAMLNVVRHYIWTHLKFQNKILHGKS